MTLQQLQEEARKEFDELFPSEIVGNCDNVDFIQTPDVVEQKDFIDSLITKAYEDGKKESLEDIQKLDNLFIK